VVAAVAHDQQLQLLFHVVVAVAVLAQHTWAEAVPLTMMMMMTTTMKTLMDDAAGPAVEEGKLAREMQVMMIDWVAVGVVEDDIAATMMKVAAGIQRQAVVVMAAVELTAGVEAAE
jgi:hypothetical protein